MNDSTQNNEADRVIANQSGPQYVNDGSVHENTSTGNRNNSSGHSHINSGGSGNVFVGRDAGDTATNGGKIYKRKFRASPFLYFGHAAKTHPVASVVITLIVGAGAVSGYAVVHAKATTPEAASLRAPTPASTSAPAVIPVPAPVPVSDDTSWPQLGGGPARTGYQPGETRIGPGNVAKLVLKRTYEPTADGASAPLIANGFLYGDVGNRLEVFDATGATGCANVPITCTPLWTAPTAYFDGMTVAKGDVFVTDGEGVQAFSAAGTTNCSGTPKTCTPLWETSLYTATGPGFTPGTGSPVVANGVLYVPGYGDGMIPSQGGAYVAAFDPAGSAGCKGTPVVCVPMWTTTGVPRSEGNDGSPAIANGVLYLTGGSTLYAFDATESSACSGTPKACAPLWTAAMSGPGYPTVAVADGIVYATTESGLYAFDAAGTRNCSTQTTAKTCAPLLTAPIEGGALAVANGVVYLANGTLYAFDAAVPENCPGTGTTRTCTLAPLWTSTDDTDVDTGSLIVANGLVYATSSGGEIDAYDAAGSLNCSVSGTAKTCTPLWDYATGYTSGGSPVIVSGVLYVSAPGNGDVYAFSS
jgi:PQQ-like domain